MLELLFPPLCAACGIRVEPKNQLCHDCLGKLKILAPPWCHRCGMAQSFEGLCLECSTNGCSLDQIRSVFIYEEPIRKLIHHWKFQDYPQLSNFFGRQLILFTELYWSQKPWEIIIPIPLHPTRKRERDYNQSHLLAKKLSGAIGIPMDLKILKRIRPTQFQSWLSETERMENLKSAFQTIPGSAQKKRILLIDDLYTTGSTLNAAASCLKKDGALQVDALTLARTLLHLK